MGKRKTADTTTDADDTGPHWLYRLSSAVVAYDHARNTADDAAEEVTAAEKALRAAKRAHRNAKEERAKRYSAVCDTMKAIGDAEQASDYASVN